jgi:hypothetical protein
MVDGVCDVAASARDDDGERGITVRENSERRNSSD